MKPRTKLSVLIIIVVIFSSTLIQTTHAKDTTNLEMKTFDLNNTEELMTFNLKKISQFDYGKKVIDLEVKDDVAYLADEDEGLLLV
ncbi:MAG: hypothetical protein ACTSP7_11625, partial [Candidatus Heimdallarchaeota archaeon]